MKHTYLLSAIVGLLFSGVAYGQNYISLAVGFSELNSTDVQVSTGRLSTDYEDSTSLVAAVGKNFASFRAEIELSSFGNDVNAHRLNLATPLQGNSGEVSALSLMVNAVKDFRGGPRFSPYIGAGIGFSDVEVQNFGTASIPRIIDGSETVFAYQFFVGAALALSETTDIFGEYRYFTTEDLGIESSASTGSTSTDFGYESNSLRFGVRFDY